MADPKTPEPVSSDDSCFIRFVGCPRSPVRLAEIRDKLFRFYSLHIVTEAEKRVLEACEAESKAKNYIERHQASHARGVAVALMCRRTHDR